MDRLEQLVGICGPLLQRVDEILSAAGASADHPIWTAVRRLRLLPADAVRSVAALRPSELQGGGQQLRAHATRCDRITEEVAAPQAWHGEAAEAYDHARRQVTAQLSGGDSLAGRLDAAAELHDALTDWMRRSRDGLAEVLTEVITSAEAVVLVAGGGSVPPFPAAEVSAAAEIGQRVLRTVAAVYDAAVELLESSAELESSSVPPWPAPG